MLAVAARDPEPALKVLEDGWKTLLRHLEDRSKESLSTLLSKMAGRLSKVELRRQVDEVPVVSLVGEIFVRRDEFSRKNIVAYLEDRGFMVRVAPVTEYMAYSGYVVNRGLGERKFTKKEKFRMRLTAQIQKWWEWRIKSILARSGLYEFEMIDVEKTIEGVRHLINVHLRGETILTVGLALREILSDSCGVVSIGPFGCMPSRVAEAILNKEMTVDGKKRVPGWEVLAGRFAAAGELPFLSIETDGMPFPQIVEANLEAFVLQAKRVHERIVSLRGRRSVKRFLQHLPVVGLYHILTRQARSVLAQKAVN
jgi:predicted nucleotide-binding protein (sugar kinase/HSP70/actin superfamily)